MASACALAIFSGKIIYNFAILENLRIFQNCLFTGGVVTENGSCGDTPSVIACGDATFPKGTALAVAGNFAAALKGAPLGELDANVVSRLRGYFPQRRTFAEGGAANAVFLYDPSREKAILENPQIFQNCEI